MEEEIKKEVEKIADKYGLDAVSFCGSKDEKFIGFIVENKQLGDFFAATLNVGRLWQHCRTGIRDILHGYEKAS